MKLKFRVYNFTPLGYVYIYKYTYIHTYNSFICLVVLLVVALVTLSLVAPLVCCCRRGLRPQSLGFRGFRV